MAPRKQPWFRFYVEAIWDRKLRRIPPAQRWVWVAVLALAKHSPRPGVLLLTDETPVGVEDIADAAAVQPRVAKAAVKSFEDQGMLLRNDDGSLSVARWNVRQFESDATANRTRKHRERTANANGMERSIDGDNPAPDTETENRDRSSSSSSSLQSPGVSSADDGDERLRRRLADEGFTGADVAIALTKLQDREAFGGDPIRDRLAWSKKVCFELSASRVAATNGGPVIAEVEGEKFELRDDEWVSVDA